MSDARTAASFRARVLAMAERRLPALTRLKQTEALPIRLNRHRIYVLPTRFGVMFSAVLLVMMLGALNYNNNPALLLSCLLAAASYQSVFQAFRTLNRIELRAVHAAACFAGDALHLSLHLHNDTHVRRDLRLVCADVDATFDLNTRGDNRIDLVLATQRRGWFRPGRMRLSSQYPFALFEVWSWINPDFAALVYPRPETRPPPLPHSAASRETHTIRRDGDEMAALREYRPGDPLRGVAWKVSARHESLLVKQFDQRVGSQVVLDYAGLHGLDREARIARLAGWVCAAESAQASYALQLPGRRIETGRGSAHRHRCLRELALMPGAAE